ncbi:MAG: carbon monoxide dehydrogenase subunit G [Pseudomonadota bacterium]
MDLKDHVVVPGTLDEVYAALNDIEVLKASIPGCEELIQTSDDQLEALVAMKVGPVKARFKGVVTLDRTGAPERFALSGEGNGGPAGMAKGGAEVALSPGPDGEGTNLSYHAKADVSGKIAQLGSRLIDATAKRLSKQFFESFAAEMESRMGPAPAVEVAPEPVTPLAPAPSLLSRLAAPFQWLLSLFSGKRPDSQSQS